MCCYNDEFSKPMENYQSGKAVYTFLEKVIEEDKHYNKIRKNTSKNNLS